MSKWIRNDRWDSYAPEIPRVRHVWVSPPTGGRGTELAGIVVSWRSEPETGRWTAQVAYAVNDQVRLEWVGADRLRPAEVVEPPNA